MGIRLITTRAIPAFHAASHQKILTRIPPGDHAMERVPNPVMPGGIPWLVMEHTKIGAAETYLMGCGNVIDDGTPEATP